MSEEPKDFPDYEPTVVVSWRCMDCMWVEQQPLFAFEAEGMWDLFHGRATFHRCGAGSDLEAQLRSEHAKFPLY